MLSELYSVEIPHRDYVALPLSNSPFCLSTRREKITGTAHRLHAYTVLPRITTLIRSSEIAVESKRRNAKIKSPLKRIKTRLMRSNGLETHRPAKILHRAAILVAVLRGICP